jgi:CheY-like chemotaxis protein
MTSVPGRILVVGADDDMRFLITNLLQTYGYETVEASNGTRSLELLDFDARIRLVITEHRLPDMDGLELTRRIRRDERLEDLPVLMQSPPALQCPETLCDAAGVTRLLPSPITTEGLRHEVEAVLSESAGGHVWKAMLIGLGHDSESTLLTSLSDAGFQVIQARDEAQARELLQKIDGVDLIFITQRHPEYGEFIRVHLLRSKKDFYLFRLVLLMGAAMAPDQFRGRFVCVAGYLMNPVTPEKVNALLQRLGLGSINSKV